MSNMNWSIRYANEGGKIVENNNCTNGKYGRAKHAACRHCGGCIEFEPEYQEYTPAGILNLGGDWSHTNHYGSPGSYRPCYIMNYKINEDKRAEPMYEGE